MSLCPVTLWTRLGEDGPFVPANVDKGPWTVETELLLSRWCWLKDRRFSFLSPWAHLLVG